MVMAVSGRMTRTGLARAACRSPFFSTSRGRTSRPPLATTAPACANCTVVTLTSWPMEMDASEVVPQRASLRRRPGDSAGRVMPVFWPKPKRRTYSYMFCCPTRMPIWMAPMLLDLASTMRHGDHAQAQVRVVDDPARQLEHAAVAIDQAFRPQVGGFERRRKGDHFENRARLERHGDGVVLPVGEASPGCGGRLGS